MSKSFFKRTGALLIAVLFFATSVAFTIVILIQANSADNNDISESNVDLNEEITNQRQEGDQMQLQGTKLDNFTPVSSVDELQTIDLEEGTGEVVQPGAQVTAHYTGALAKDGTIFQSSHDFGEPIPFSLNEVISGWTEGVPGMKVGGKRRLIIPAEKAYGAEEKSGIPANSDLVFDIEIVAVEQQP